MAQCSDKQTETRQGAAAQQQCHEAVDEDINVLNRFKNTFREDVEVFLAKTKLGKREFSEGC